MGRLSASQLVVTTASPAGVADRKRPYPSYAYVKPTSPTSRHSTGRPQPQRACDRPLVDRADGRTSPTHVALLPAAKEAGAYHTRRETARIAAWMDFELVGDITDVETIAAGRGIRDLKRLRRCMAAGLEEDERQRPDPVAERPDSTC